MVPRSQWIYSAWKNEADILEVVLGVIPPACDYVGYLADFCVSYGGEESYRPSFGTRLPDLRLQLQVVVPDLQTQTRHKVPNTCFNINYEWHFRRGMRQLRSWQNLDRYLVLWHLERDATLEELDPFCTVVVYFTL